MLQAEDRIHRMGQKNKTCVNYHYLYGPDTLDSLLYEKLHTKLAIVSEILEGKTTYLDVEETKENMGDVSPDPEQASSKRKKDGYGREKSTGSSLLKPGDKSNGQITSFFRKKEPVSSENNSKTVPFEMTERQIRSDNVKADSLDWDDVEMMLEEDRNLKLSQAMEETKISKTYQERRPISPFNEVTFNPRAEEDESKQKMHAELDRMRVKEV